MKIKITNVLSPELANNFLKFSSNLQAFLSKKFEEFNAGIEISMFMAVFVVVDDDPFINEKFARQHDQSTRYKGVDGNWVTAIEVAVSISPAEVHKVIQSNGEFERLLLDAFLARLDIPIKRIPKGFRQQEFLKLMNEAISEYSLNLPKTKFS